MSEEAPPVQARRPRLGRLRDAFRRADWFLVGLEVAVVAVGVLLGVQADQWADFRKQRREEQAYLRRLWDETEINVAELQRLVRVHRDAEAQMKGATVQIFQEGGLDGLGRPGFGCGALALPAAKLATSGYDELSTANKFDILRDPELKQRLRLARAEHDYARAQLDYTRYTATQLLRPYLDTLRWRFDAEADGPVCRVAWNEVRASPAAQAALIRAHRQHHQMAEYRTAELRRVLDVRRRLACLLDEPGCAIADEKRAAPSSRP